MAAFIDSAAEQGGAGRRVLARLEPAAEQFVLAARADGFSARAEVIDFNSTGLRLLFRPAIDLNPGMTIGICPASGADSPPGPGDAAEVRWCHHKYHFTVAGVRACGAPFALDLEPALPAHQGR